LRMPGGDRWPSGRGTRRTLPRSAPYPGTPQVRSMHRCRRWSTAGSGSRWCCTPGQIALWGGSASTANLELLVRARSYLHNGRRWRRSSGPAALPLSLTVQPPHVRPGPRPRLAAAARVRRRGNRLQSPASASSTEPCQRRCTLPQVLSHEIVSSLTSASLPACSAVGTHWELYVCWGCRGPKALPRVAMCGSNTRLSGDSLLDSTDRSRVTLLIESVTEGSWSPAAPFMR
jgi:hypothetical protein